MSTIRCPSCKTELPPGSHFCRSCGSMMIGNGQDDEQQTLAVSDEENLSTVPQSVDPNVGFLPISGEFGSPLHGNAPIVQGTPQVGGVPSVQGTPQMPDSSLSPRGFSQQGHLHQQPPHHMQAPSQQSLYAPRPEHQFQQPGHHLFSQEVPHQQIGRASCRERV